jgi:putative membrane protein
MADSESLTLPSRGERSVLVSGLLIALFLSGWQPHDRLTWLLEVIWVLLGLPLAILIWPRFPLTRLLAWALTLHALILIYGGAYTYALTPLGLHLQESFGWARNHYDRLGHFAQGFVPAILVRELLLRTSPLTRGRWLFLLVTCACLAFSAFFEMIEWWAALIWGADATSFLATQGDVWDTQWDMFYALCGAVLAQLSLSRIHDRQLGLTSR